MIMFGKCCKECGKPAKQMGYCDKHFNKDKMVNIFKNSCKKHLAKFDKQKKHHQKKGIIGNIFDELHNIYTKIIRPHL